MKRIFYHTCIGVTFLITLGFLWQSTAQEMSSIEIRRKFRKVIRLLEEGQEAEAGRQLDEVLRALLRHPDEELILELVDEAGYQWFLRAMMAKPKPGDSEEDRVAIERLAKVAERFLKLASIEKKKRMASRRKIIRLLNKLASSQHDERYYLMEVISNTIGQYIFLYDQIPSILGDETNQLHIPLIILLTRMGDQVTLPLIELLDSNDSLVRRNVAAILGNIRDRRAIPALVRLVQTDREASVKEAARKALEKMLGKVELRPAKEYYLALAEKYYENDPVFTRNPYREYVIWKWDRGRLHYWQVPKILFNECLAEEALLDAIDLDPDYTDAWALLVNVYFAELNEVKSSLQVALNLSAQGKLSEKGREEMDTLQVAARALQMVRVVTALRGKKLLFQALARAMEDKRAEEAASCIRMLRELKIDGSLLPAAEASVPSPSPALRATRARRVVTPVETEGAKALGAPLIQALSYEDKRVRYEAAIALAHLNPEKNFQGSEKVVEVLMEAVSELAPRTVLVIAEDPHVQNSFRSKLLKLNYSPYIASSGREGLIRALSMPTWDVIFVSDYLSDYRSYEIINKLKNDYRTKHIPIYVLVKPNLRAKMVTEGVISTTVSLPMLKETLRQLFSSEEYQSDIKARTVKIARRAAEALASIPVNRTHLQPERAVKRLLEVLPKHPAEVKIPILKALANIADPQSLSVLLAVFDKDSGNEEAVRLAACYAIGEVLKKMGEVSQDAYLALKAALQEPSFKINQAAALALGKVELAPTMYKELVNLRDSRGREFLFRHMVKIRRSRSED